MPQCVALGCDFQSKCNSDSDVILHGFPQDPERRKKWEAACGCAVLPKVPRLCSRHFSADAFEDFNRPRLLKELMGASGYKRRLKPDALPTIFFHKDPKRSKKQLRPETPDTLQDGCKQHTSPRAGVEEKDDPSAEKHNEVDEITSSKSLDSDPDWEPYLICGQVETANSVRSDKARRSKPLPLIPAVTPSTAPDTELDNGAASSKSLDSDPDWEPYLICGQVETSNSMRFDNARRSKPLPLTVPFSTGPDTELDNGAAPNMTATADEVEIWQINEEDDELQQECELCSLRCEEIMLLQEENQKLREELSKKSLDENFLKDNDPKVKYYTGLPSFALLMDVLMHILPSLPNTDIKVSHFQMLLLTLMRLRLNLPLKHIAHLFDISRTTTSILFDNTVSVLYVHFSPLVHWPERHCIEASVPHEHEEVFGERVTVIIDCFELCIERAQILHAKAETHSSNKSKNTMKYLIGITLQGTVSFISQGWGGGVSDQHVAKNCGFLQKLSPGDLVLAIREFDIEESIALAGATLKIAAFTQGRSQKDAEETRNLAGVRSHAERVIGCLRSKFSILNDTIGLSLVVPREGETMTLLDKIVTVSCALVNLCPTVALEQ